MLEWCIVRVMVSIDGALVVVLAETAWVLVVVVVADDGSEGGGVAVMVVG